ncbi:MAG: hypothetical protein M1827_003656 [Pycnora praestabilis]|nr:MAG: hypothetical protein M1827_003656 [Pycnora praestabilis]
MDVDLTDGQPRRLFANLWNGSGPMDVDQWRRTMTNFGDSMDLDTKQRTTDRPIDNSTGSVYPRSGWPLPNRRMLYSANLLTFEDSPNYAPDDETMRGYTLDTAQNFPKASYNRLLWIKSCAAPNRYPNREQWVGKCLQSTNARTGKRRTNSKKQYQIPIKCNMRQRAMEDQMAAKVPMNATTSSRRAIGHRQSSKSQDFPIFQANLLKFPEITLVLRCYYTNVQLRQDSVRIFSGITPDLKVLDLQESTTETKWAPYFWHPTQEIITDIPQSDLPIFGCGYTVPKEPKYKEAIKSMKTSYRQGTPGQMAPPDVVYLSGLKDLIDQCPVKDGRERITAYIPNDQIPRLGPTLANLVLPKTSKCQSIRQLPHIPGIHRPAVSPAEGLEPMRPPARFNLLHVLQSRREARRIRHRGLYRGGQGWDQQGYLPVNLRTQASAQKLQSVIPARASGSGGAANGNEDRNGTKSKTKEGLFADLRNKIFQIEIAAAAAKESGARRGES